MRKEIIGNATLYLGDCRLVLTLLGPFAAVITDPPYGIGLAHGYVAKQWEGARITGDQDTSARDEALKLAGCDTWAVFASPRASAPTGWKSLVIWDKGGNSGSGDLRMPWKPCFEFVYVAGLWRGARRSGIVYVPNIAGCNGSRNDGTKHHPTEKPEAIMAHFVERAPEGVIVDPFMGSGTTGVACYRLGREFVGVEIDPMHFDTACERIENAQRQERLFA